MKQLLVLLLLAASSVATAANSPYRLRLPLTLSCTSNATSSAVQDFEIEMEMGEAPYIALDASFIEKGVTNGTFSMVFSNQCDNAYTLSFNNQRLSAVSEGELDTINGTLEYFDTSLIESKGDTKETVTITCTKLPEFVQTKRDLLSNATTLLRYLNSANAKRIECSSEKGSKLIIAKGNNPEDQTGLVVLGDFQYGTNEIKQISLGETSLIKFGEEGNYQFVFELTENPKQFGYVGSAYVVSEADSLTPLSCKLK